MPRDTDLPAAIPLTEQAAAFALQRIITRAPWSGQPRRNIASVLHQVAAEALAAALAADGITLTRPAPPPLRDSPPMMQAVSLPDHPAD